MFENVDTRCASPVHWHTRMSLFAVWRINHLGAIQVLRNADGGGGGGV